MDTDSLADIRTDLTRAEVLGRLFAATEFLLTRPADPFARQRVALAWSAAADRLPELRESSFAYDAIQRIAQE